MEWSPQQDAALKAVDYWFKNQTKEKQVFRLFGWAGSGKSTLAKYFAANINGTVKYATFTGKAAHVMASKGCEGASTIHKLIYIPIASSKKKLNELQDQLDAAKANPEPDWSLIKRLEVAVKEERENAGRMSFALNHDSQLKYAKLLIVDEVSMVGSDMGKDLESFGVPILVLGDPEQLPPIYGSGHFTDRDPDILLTEIHRQARDNPIIEMSRLVREGIPLNLGSYGTSRVISTKLDAQEVMEHDIILVGLRKTKKAVDDKYRSLKGYNHPYPLTGERLMCVKNNHELGLLNGQMWITQNAAVDMGNEVSLHIREEDGTNELGVSAAAVLFKGEKLGRWEHIDYVQEFEYGYGITVHKSQGSQWGNVLLVDQKHKFPNFSARDQRRWLYTGITRASERVTVMRF